MYQRKISAKTLHEGWYYMGKTMSPDAPDEAWEVHTFLGSLVADLNDHGEITVLNEDKAYSIWCTRRGLETYRVYSNMTRAKAVDTAEQYSRGVPGVVYVKRREVIVSEYFHNGRRIPASEIGAIVFGPDLPDGFEELLK